MIVLECKDAVEHFVAPVNGGRKIRSVRHLDNKLLDAGKQLRNNKCYEEDDEYEQRNIGRKDGQRTSEPLGGDLNKNAILIKSDQGNAKIRHDSANDNRRKNRKLVSQDREESTEFIKIDNKNKQEDQRGVNDR